MKRGDTEMTIEQSIIDMIEELTNKSNFLTRPESVVEITENFAVRLSAVDFGKIEFAITDGEKTFRIHNSRIFVKLVEFLVS
jgi:hypothetical protein